MLSSDRHTTDATPHPCRQAADEPMDVEAPSARTEVHDALLRHCHGLDRVDMDLLRGVFPRRRVDPGPRKRARRVPTGPADAPATPRRPRRGAQMQTTRR
ncbi:hypothetical protein GCM10020295_77940 [Streptomyces cinereospinus]